MMIAQVVNFTVSAKGLSARVLFEIPRPGINSLQVDSAFRAKKEESTEPSRVMDPQAFFGTARCKTLRTRHSMAVLVEVTLGLFPLAEIAIHLTVMPTFGVVTNVAVVAVLHPVEQSVDFSED